MSDTRKTMGSVGKVGLAVMVSRILGLVRDQVFAFLFGAGYFMDCFVVAFRIPNLLRDLFAEGALSPAFVTVFSRRRRDPEGAESAWRLGRLVTTLQIVVLLALIVPGILLAPWVVGLIAPGFGADPEKFNLTVQLTRILFPFILFVAMAALSMGMLNACGRFGLPASASSFFNLGSIVVGLGLVLWLDPGFGQTAIICMTVGTLFGGILQWLIQVPALGKLGYHYRPAWNPSDPGVREILHLMVPTLVGASAVQINVMINTMFASELTDGSVSWLSYAFRLIQLPIGLFGVAISTVALPSLAVEALQTDRTAFRERLEGSLRLNAALCLPAACGLALLSVPLVGLLFQLPGSKFDSLATFATAEVLRAYTVGLIGYASIKVLTVAFYALNRTIIPMAVALGSIAATAGLNWLLVRRLQFEAPGLALTTSITSLGSAALLLAVLGRVVGGPSRESWATLVRILGACAVMSAVVWGIDSLHTWLGVGYTFAGDLSRVLLGVPAGVLTYLLVARTFRIREVEEMRQAFLAKLRPVDADGNHPHPEGKT